MPAACAGSTSVDASILIALRRATRSPIPSILQDRLTLPAIGAPLFIVSVPELVIAQCKAGIVGPFPALNARPKERLEEWIVQIKTELAAYQKEHPNGRVAPF